MNCVKCGCTDLTYDEVTGMYFCPNCNQLYEKDEIKFDDEDEENLHSDRDLNGLSLVILHMVQSVPIIGMLIPIFISNSDIKESYKRYFGYRFIAQVINTSIVVILFVVFIIGGRIDYMKAISYGLNECVEFITPKVSKLDLKSRIPDLSSKSAEEMLPTIDITEIEKAYVPQDNWELLNGVVMTGKQAINLVDATSDYKISYLVQSTEIAERHGNNTYRNVGYILDGATRDSTKSSTWFINKVNEYDFYTDDYGELVYASIDDLKNSKYIFYLNPKKEYTMNVVKMADDTVIGFMFTEVGN